MVEEERRTDDSGALAALGVAAEEGRVQVCRCISERGEESPHSVLDLELREGKRACERSLGPLQKCGAFDMQKLADLSIACDPLCPESNGKELCAAVGGQCARSSCPPLRAGHVLGW